MVAEADDGTLLVGPAARARLTADAASGIARFKTGLGGSHGATSGARTW